MKAEKVDLIKDGPFDNGVLSVAFGAAQAKLLEASEFDRKLLIYSPNPCFLYAGPDEIILPGYSLTAVEPGTKIKLAINDLEEKVKTIVLGVDESARLDAEQQAFIDQSYVVSRNKFN